MTTGPDLLVAGGGPAGLATALHAARAGLHVEVWEPRECAIDKACGEGLMPGALAALNRLGVDPPGQPLLGIRYVAGGRAAEAAFRAGYGRGIRRTTLHAALRDAVQEAGIAIVRRHVREARCDTTGVDVDGLRVGHLVAADGLHSPLRHSLGLDARQRGRPRYGLRRHYALAPWSSQVEVHWGRHAEVYVTPVAADLVGIAVLTSTRASYEQHLLQFPDLLDRLVGAEPASNVRGAGPLRQGARRRTTGRVLLVGDAAGYVDALTGEGIALALGQAKAAVDAVVADDLAGYEREWRMLTRRYRWLTGALVAATAPRLLRSAVVPAARLFPPVFSAAVNALAHPVGG